MNGNETDPRNAPELAETQSTVGIINARQYIFHLAGIFKRSNDAKLNSVCFYLDADVHYLIKLHA